ncbi:MAG: hypothetical protein ACPKPY_11435, partial [Nitrososphaeraceae archaeon]
MVHNKIEEWIRKGEELVLRRWSEIRDTGNALLEGALELEKAMKNGNKNNTSTSNQTSVDNRFLVPNISNRTITNQAPTLSDMVGASILSDLPTSSNDQVIQNGTLASTPNPVISPELQTNIEAAREALLGFNQSLAENNILSEVQLANTALLGESLQTGTLPGILGLVAGHDQLLMSQDNLALSQQNTLANAELARQSMVDTLPDLFGLVGGTDQLKQSQEGVALGMQNTGSA